MLLARHKSGTRRIQHKEHTRYLDRETQAERLDVESLALASHAARRTASDDRNSMARPSTAREVEARGDPAASV